MGFGQGIRQGEEKRGRSERMKELASAGLWLDMEECKYTSVVQG